jgi:hypothetical protein
VESVPFGSTSERALLPAVRYGLPAVLVIIGFVVLFTVRGALRWDGWAMFVGSGLSVLLLNWFFRLSAKGEQDRDAEAAAREYLAAHGHWPDDSPSAP